PAEDVAAIIFEPVQGEGGYICPPPRYVEALGKLAKEKNILVIYDEIQSGIGRTGKFFAAEHYNLEPDIICMGKAVGGGFPLAVVGARKEIMSQWSTGAHGTTFGGHPTACAAALPIIKTVSDPAFLKNVTEQGEYLRSRLRELQARFRAIGDVRGLGLMNAIEMVKGDNIPDPDLAKHVIQNLQARKILLLNCGVYGNAIRFIPPLNVERKLLDEVVDALGEALIEETKAH
ncbi:MAG: aminotransferase class III-fold pyridoxal phosphate-dependent enzyme, partial [Deltaproteobacteria bacterium]|nr:aminotransferase class III-fold pyridoxal phosphate-dependent enzyme [Deltaproteobacteria bacterium]